MNHEHGDGPGTTDQNRVWSAPVGTPLPKRMPPEPNIGEWKNVGYTTMNEIREWKLPVRSLYVHWGDVLLFNLQVDTEEDLQRWADLYGWSPQLDKGVYYEFFVLGKPAALLVSAASKEAGQDV